MVQCLLRWKFERSSTKMPNGCEHSLLGWWKKCCSISLLRFAFSSKVKRSQSKRRNLECNQRFGSGEIPWPWHGWTQYELECTWFDKWPPSCQWVSKNIGHWFLLIAYSSWCLPNRNDQTWIGQVKILQELYKIFDKSPAHRDVYVREGTSEVFPIKFCSTKWIEDQLVADQALGVWPSVVSTVKHWLSFSKSMRPKDNKSYDTLVEHHQDSLIPAKCNFFSFIAGVLKPYLDIFRSDCPLLPFMIDEISLILYCLVRLVYKKVANAINLRKVMNK